MEFSIENISHLKYRIKIIINTNQINNDFQKKLIDLTKKIHIDGFRKGKVPINIIKNRYGLSAIQDVLDQTMKKKFIEIIDKENINVAGKPNYIHEEYTDNKDFTYYVEFETYPNIELKNLNKIKIEKPLVNITKDDITFVIEILRKQKAKWITSHSSVKINDRVTIDLIGDINGNKVESIIHKDYVIILGQGQIIKELEESLIGHTQNDTFSVNIKFPSNYHDKTLVDKNVNFKVFLKRIENLRLPALNTNFIKSLGIKDGSTKSLYDVVQKSMEKELIKIINDSLKSQVINGLIKENQIDLPQSLVNHEIKLMNQYLEESSNKNKFNMSELNIKLLEEKAKYRITANLLLGEFIRNNKIKIDENRINNLLQEISYKYNDHKKIIKLYSDKQFVSNIRNTVLEEQAVEAILKIAQINHIPTDFKNIFNKKNHLS